MTHVWPAVIVGSGAAGLMAAASLAEVFRPLVLTDRGLGTSNSAVAQGGLQYPPPGEEGARLFLEDIVASAGPTADTARIRDFVDQVPETIRTLESWGLVLDRDETGELTRVRAGGMSQASVVTAGDEIGPTVIRLLRDRVTHRAEVRTRAKVAGLRPQEGRLRVDLAAGSSLSADNVIIATGGSTHALAKRPIPSTNPTNDNASMQSILRGLGLPEIDPGLLQYQPYGLVDSFEGSVARCVPESVVALGARVVDSADDEVAPPGANRLQLTAAMLECLDTPRLIPRVDGRSALRLTLSRIDPADISSRYPKLARFLARAEMIGRDVDVWPVPHYQLGGFATRLDGSTKVPGLYLAGEVTGGLHGQNRLMGNGITDSLVGGRRAALAVLRRLDFGGTHPPKS